MDMSWQLFDLHRDDDETISGGRIIDDEDGYRSEPVRFSNLDEVLRSTGGSHVVSGRSGSAAWAPEDVTVVVRIDGAVLDPDGCAVKPGWMERAGRIRSVGSARQ